MSRTTVLVAVGRVKEVSNFGGVFKLGTAPLLIFQGGVLLGPGGQFHRTLRKSGFTASLNKLVADRSCKGTCDCESIEDSSICSAGG